MNGIKVMMNVCIVIVFMFKNKIDKYPVSYTQNSISGLLISQRLLLCRHLGYSFDGNLVKSTGMLKFVWINNVFCVRKLMCVMPLKTFSWSFF